MSIEYIEVTVPRLHTGEPVSIIGFSPAWSRRQIRRARDLADLLKFHGIPAVVRVPIQQIQHREEKADG